MQITLVVERSRPDPGEWAGDVGRYQRWIEDLERYAQSQLNIVEDFSGVSPEGFVLLYSTASLSTSLAASAEYLRAALPSRLVLLRSVGKRRWISSRSTHSRV